MKTVAQLLFPLALLLGACTGQDKEPDSRAGLNDGQRDGSTATDTGDSPDDSFPEDSDRSSTDTSNSDGDSDTGHDGTPLDTASPDTDQDRESDVDTADQDPPELDTASPEEGYGCDIPSGLLEPQKGETSYAIFDFGGVISDPDAQNPKPGQGDFSIKLRGKEVPLEVESMTAYYSYSMPGVVVQGYSVPDRTTGDMVYLEAKIATADLMEMNAYGEEHMDIFEPPTGNTSPTNVRIYEGRRNARGDIESLCLSAVPGTNGNPELTGLWPLWLCNTSIDWMDNVGHPFGMAGNVAMFDDRETLEEAFGMRCVCPNGAGSWRNCDEGTPDAYGLLKFNFKYGGSAGDWWTGYIYDEDILADREGLNQSYGQQHPEGIWQRYWSPILGGLNISAKGTDPTDGHTIYRFGQLITPQNNVTVIGLVSKDHRNNRFVVRQHVFDAYDLSGETMEGYWINAYLPGDIAPGAAVPFGTGKNKAKLFVYDPNNANCIMAIACRGEVGVLETSKNLSAKEGGKLHLKTEVDAFDTRQAVQLWHPSALPEECDYSTYLAESLQPQNIAVCDKI